MSSLKLRATSPTRLAALLLLIPWTAPKAAAQENLVPLDAGWVRLGGNNTNPYSDHLDIDGDGDVDLVGSKSESARRYVNVYINNGVGGLSNGPGTSLPDAGTGPLAIATGDIGARDGREEVVFSFTNTILVYTEVATLPGIFTTVESHTTTSTVLSATTGDYDADGRGDYAVLTEDALLVYLHPASGAVSERALPLRRPAYVVTTGKVGLGRGVGFVLTDPERVEITSLAIEKPLRQVAQESPFVFRHGLTHPMTTVGDVDGDGDDDVVLFGMSTYRVLRQRHNGRFDLEPLQTGGPATGLADIDGDGDLDGVCCGGGGPPPITNISDFELSVNDGTGAFAPAFKLHGIGARQIAAATDLDGDGDTDLAAGRVVYYAAGPIRPPILLPSPPHPAAIGDIDGDGDPDLELGMGEVLLNQGDGRFVDATITLPDPPPGATFLAPGIPGDFDGDGTSDLLVECWSGPVFDGLHLLHNLGGGAFEDQGVIALPATPFSSMTTLAPDSYVVDDLDGDGRKDVALLSAFGSPTLFTWLWFNDPNGGLSEGPLWNGERLLDVDQMTADALPDLLLASNGLRYRNNLGNRAFGPLSTFLGSSFATFATAAQFDATRDIASLAVTGLSGSTLADAVSCHRSGSAFTPDTPRSCFLVPESAPAQSYGSVSGDEANSSYHYLAADVDDDGDAEGLASPAHNTANGSLVMMGQLGVFSPNFFLTQTLLASAFADVDGDGDVDALGDQVYFARRYRGPDAGARVQYAQGFPGSGGLVPTLGAVGPFREGKTIEFRITGARGGALARFGISRAGASLANTPVAGVSTWIDPTDPAYQLVPVVLQGTSGAPGEGKATIPFSVPVGYAGITEYFQVFVFDSLAPNGISATNGLRITFGK